MVDRLQDAGLVERRADASDRRSWRLHLTPKARDMLEQLRPLAEVMVEEALDGIDHSDRQKLGELLERIRQNLSRKLIEQAASNG